MIRTKKYTHKHISQTIYAHQRDTSRRRNHSEPSYSLSEFREWLLKQPRYRSLLMMHEIKSKVKHRSNSRPSVDRIKDNLPYTFDNMQVMTWEENNDKGIKSRSKAVGQFLNGNLVKEFVSTREAARELGLNQTSISAVCNCIRRTTGGFTFKFI